MTGFADIDSVVVPRTITDSGQEFLRFAGSNGNEGMILWIGKRHGRNFFVSDLVVPNQRGVQTPDGVCVVVDGPELHRINLDLYRTGRQLIGQLHSHPTHAYHSDMDDEFAIARRIGALSLVIPDFARRPFSLDECAVYRLDAAGHWKDICGAQARQLIRIVD